MGFRPEETADDPFESDIDSSSSDSDIQKEDMTSSDKANSSIIAPEYDALDSDCLSD